MLRLSLRILAAAGAALFVTIAYVYVTLPDVRPLATTNPTTTAFMELRDREARAAGKPVRRVQRWVPYARISPTLKRAVLVAEDDAFFQHDGVSYAQVAEARRSAVRALARSWLRIGKGGSVRGASTITQQLAKNLYLSPSQNPLRKLRELIITRRLEAALGKERIFELYLNLIEWGDGVWGAEAAARTYFKTSAAALSPSQSALLAGAIINPRVHNPAHPTRRLLRRQAIVLSRMSRRGVTPTPLPPLSSDDSPGAADEVTEPAPPAVPAESPGTGETDASKSEPGP